MKNAVLWIIVVFSICLGAAGVLFFLMAGIPNPDVTEASRIISAVAGGICLGVAAVLLIFSGVMFRISK